MSTSEHETVLEFMRNLKPCPEFQRGLLEASAKAFNEHPRPSVIDMYEERKIRELEARIAELERQLKEKDKV